MTPAFSHTGKQVLWLGTHYADACTDSAARQIAAAFNQTSQPDRDATRTPRRVSPSVVPALPLCRVCNHWSQGDVCAHIACPGRSLSRPSSGIALVHDGHAAPDTTEMEGIRHAK